MKRFFLCAVAYAGLYAEIFSASCRWLTTPRRTPWKSFVTKSLVTAGYLHPTAEEVAAKKLQQDIVEKFGEQYFHSKQPETIQTCLKWDLTLLRKAYRTSYPPQATSEAQILAIPEFVKHSEL